MCAATVVKVTAVAANDMHDAYGNATSKAVYSTVGGKFSLTKVIFSLTCAKTTGM